MRETCKAKSNAFFFYSLCRAFGLTPPAAVKPPPSAPKWLLAIGYARTSLRRVCALLLPVDRVVEDFQVFLDDIG